MGETLDLFFGMKLRTPTFSIFTDLPAKTDKGCCYFFSLPDTLPAPNNPIELSPSEVRLAGRSVNVSLSSPDKVVSVVLATVDGAKMIDTVLPVLREQQDDPVGHVLHNLDVAGFRPGLYTLSVTSSGETTQTQFLIGFEADNWFAVAHLRVDTTDVSVLEARGRYEVSFNPKSAVWEYVVALTREGLGDEYRVKQVKPLNNTDDNFVSIEFADPVVVEAKPDSKTLLFRSTQSVTYKERQPFTLVLAKTPTDPAVGNGDGTEMEVVLSLPLPSPFRAKAAVHVRV